MLRGIRNASNTWLGRILMGAVMTLLAGIFALWGINDIFRGFSRTVACHDRQHRDHRRPVPSKLQRPVASAFPANRQSCHAGPGCLIGLPRQVLSEMVAQAGLDQRAKQMRLGTVRCRISRRITSNPQFQTPDGKFDRARFQDALLNANLTEQRFIADQRANTLRRQIIDSVSGNIPTPQTWLDAINQFQNQERSVSYLALGPAQAGDIPPPTDEQLAKYFDERKIMFRAPEYRKIVTVTVTPAELGKTLEISEEELKKIFDSYRSRYITPEKRHVEQMVFPTWPKRRPQATRSRAERRLRPWPSSAASRNRISISAR